MLVKKCNALTGLVLLLMNVNPLLSLSAQASSQCFDHSQTVRPKIGLALGGGGARGYAHIGVLQVLEEMRIPVDYIAGTSMGSIVGGLAATGMGSEEILDVVNNADWEELFKDNTARSEIPARRKADDSLGLFGPKFGIGKENESLPEGVIAGQKVLLLFESETSNRVQTRNFDHLPVPYRAVATDIVTGEMVVINEGSLAVAMRASMAVPAYFDPVRKDGRLLVDGGLVRNLPVDVVREMGADLVIAVDVGTPLRDANNIGNILSIVDQMSSLLIVKNTREQIEQLYERDTLITPKLGHEISAADFSAVDKVVALGYEGADRVRSKLAEYAVSESNYLLWQQHKESCVTGLPEIQFVKLDNRSRFSDKVINELINVHPGDLLNTEQVDKDLRQIYALGFIHLAYYEMIEENGQNGIEFHVLQSSRGTDFIETGLSINGGTRSTEIGFKAAYLKTDLDERGSEVRAAVQLGNDTGLLLDYYKPLDDRLRYIFQPEFSISRRDLLLFDNSGRALAQVDIDEIGTGLKFGREFGRHAGIFASVSRYSGSAQISLGQPGPKIRFDGGEWGLSFVYDRLDNRFLPSSGSLIKLDYIVSDKNLGADSEFEQIQFDFLSSKTWGEHNLLLAGRFNTTLDNNAPIYALFTGGGQLNMSGFEPNELIGQHFGMVAAGYRYNVVQSGLMPAYAGFTLEYGNAAERAGDVFGKGILNASLYMSYDSPLGPVYLGYGFNENSSGVYFLTLGSLLGSQSIGRR
ncbi:MAG: NTE family protein [Rhodothermales bacterium]|jgi:NTE family protein